MNPTTTEAIRLAVDHEIGRTSYPDHLPSLPPLPTARYCDRGFHDLEMKHLWTRTWLNVGHVSQLPAPGSYRLFEQLDRSVILHRGSDDRIRAFHNVCRHRGSPLLLKPEGVARRFICPYHAWGYSEDGSLVSVPDARDFDCLDKSENGLIAVRCETLRGLVFINFDDDARPLAETHGSVGEQVGDFPLEDVVVKGVITVPLECNWKIAYDNFLEIYHLRTVHAKSVARFLNPDSFSISLYAGGHSRFVTRKRDSSSVFGKDAPTADRPDRFFMDYTLALPIFPNTFMPMDPIGFTCQGYWPDGPDRSVMVMYMMGWKADGEEDVAFWDGMRAQIHGIIAEDVELFAGLQRSLRSGILPAMRVNCQERAIYWYHQHIDQVVGPEKIPEAMRVRPVLAASD